MILVAIISSTVRLRQAAHSLIIIRFFPRLAEIGSTIRVYRCWSWPERIVIENPPGNRSSQKHRDMGAFGDLRPRRGQFPSGRVEPVKGVADGPLPKSPGNV